jgi:hypothetical protein
MAQEREVRILLIEIVLSSCEGIARRATAAT